MRANHRKNLRMYSHAMHLWTLFLLFLRINSHWIQSLMHRPYWTKLHADCKVANRTCLILVLIKLFKFLEISADGIPSAISWYHNKDHMVYTLLYRILSSFYCAGFLLCYNCLCYPLCDCYSHVSNNSFSIYMPWKCVIMANHRNILVVWALHSYNIRYYLLSDSLYSQYCLNSLRNRHRRCSDLWWDFPAITKRHSQYSSRSLLDVR